MNNEIRDRVLAQAADRWAKTEAAEAQERKELKALVDKHRPENEYVKVAQLTLYITAKKKHCMACRFLILDVEKWCALYSEGLKKDKGHDLRCDSCLQDFGE